MASLVIRFFSLIQYPGAPREILGPGAKILFGPFGQWYPKITWWAKKGHSVRRCSNFGPKSSDEQKKDHSLRRCSNFGSTSSDEQNKVIASADVRISARNLKKSIIASAGRSLSWWILHSKPDNSEPWPPLCPRASGQWPLLPLPPFSAGLTVPSNQSRHTNFCNFVTKVNKIAKTVGFPGTFEHKAFGTLLWYHSKVFSNFSRNVWANNSETTKYQIRIS